MASFFMFSTWLSVSYIGLLQHIKPALFMFFFKKKKPKLKRKEDSIWISKAMKYKGLQEKATQLIAEGQIVFIISFFSESQEEFAFILERTNSPFTSLNHHISSPEDLPIKSMILVSAQWLQTTFTKSAEQFQQSAIAFLFLSHYPTPNTEEKLSESLSQYQWPNAYYQYFESMDSKLMDLFGSERITEMMKRMGMQADEEISHSMVTKSIRRAQEKLGSMIHHEHKTTSEEEWYRKNTKPS